METLIGAIAGATAALAIGAAAHVLTKRRSAARQLRARIEAITAPRPWWTQPPLAELGRRAEPGPGAAGPDAEARVIAACAKIRREHVAETGKL